MIIYQHLSNQIQNHKYRILIFYPIITHFHLFIHLINTHIKMALLTAAKACKTNKAQLYFYEINNQKINRYFMLDEIFS